MPVGREAIPLRRPIPAWAGRRAGPHERLRFGAREPPAHAAKIGEVRAGRRCRVRGARGR